MKKILDLIGLACDLAWPGLAVITGLALIVGGQTGVLW